MTNAERMETIIKLTEIYNDWDERNVFINPKYIMSMELVDMSHAPHPKAKNYTYLRLTDKDSYRVVELPEQIIEMLK